MLQSSCLYLMWIFWNTCNIDYLDIAHLPHQPHGGVLSLPSFQNQGLVHGVTGIDLCCKNRKIPYTWHPFLLPRYMISKFSSLFCWEITLDTLINFYPCEQFPHDSSGPRSLVPWNRTWHNYDNFHSCEQLPHDSSGHFSLLAWNRTWHNDDRFYPYEQLPHETTLVELLTKRTLLRCDTGLWGCTADAPRNSDVPGQRLANFHV